jgi:hypothetical protein
VRDHDNVHLPLGDERLDLWTRFLVAGSIWLLPISESGGLLACTRSSTAHLYVSGGKLWNGFWAQPHRPAA